MLYHTVKTIVYISAFLLSLMTEQWSTCDDSMTGGRCFAVWHERVKASVVYIR